MQHLVPDCSSAPAQPVLPDRRCGPHPDRMVQPGRVSKERSGDSRETGVRAGGVACDSVVSDGSRARHSHTQTHTCSSSVPSTASVSATGSQEPTLCPALCRMSSTAEPPEERRAGLYPGNLIVLEIC